MSLLDNLAISPTVADIKKLTTAVAVLESKVKDGQFRNEVISFLEEVASEMLLKVKAREQK